MRQSRAESLSVTSLDVSQAVASVSPAARASMRLNMLFFFIYYNVG